MGKRRGGQRNKRRGECFSTKGHMILLVGETFCFEEPVRKSCLCETYREQLEERSTRLLFSREKKSHFGISSLLVHYKRML